MSTSVVRDGIRLTMTIDGLPLVRAKSAVAWLRVTNVGRDTIHWNGGQCDTLERPIYVFPRGAWVGRKDLTGIERKFKRLVLNSVGASDVDFGFFSDRPRKPPATTAVRFTGASAAGGVAYLCTLVPGASIFSSHLYWSGPRGLVVPDMPVRIRGDVLFNYWRGERQPPRRYRGLSVNLQSRLRTGIKDVPQLLLGEAIDAGLADPTFRDWLRATEGDHWQNANIGYDGRIWIIGLFSFSRNGPYREVKVDAHDRHVIGVGP